jgi:glycosyltransferase involved in cell wall biosynthesis
LSFCSELIVLDSGSDDGTVAIARSHGARVIDQKEGAEDEARYP